MLAEELAGQANNLVTGVVAVRVVVALEVVHVEEQQGDGKVLRVGTGKDFRQSLMKESPVRQAGAFVSDRELMPLALLGSRLENVAYQCRIVGQLGGIRRCIRFADRLPYGHLSNPSLTANQGSGKNGCGGLIPTRNRGALHRKSHTPGVQDHSH